MAFLGRLGKRLGKKIFLGRRMRRLETRAVFGKTGLWRHKGKNLIKRIHRAHFSTAAWNAKGAISQRRAVMGTAGVLGGGAYAHARYRQR